MKYDIVIIGGGIIGSSIAYHLLRDGASGTVAVIEPDPTYEHAAAPRSSGGIRRLFSRPENILMSQYGVEFYTAFPETMAVEGMPAPIDFRREGYLFLAGEHDAASLEENARLQQELGVNIEVLDAPALRRRFPSLSVDDVALATLSVEDGWIDPYAAVQGFRRKARSLGARYIERRVAALESAGRRAATAILDEGDPVQGEVFVLAAGAWSGAIAATVGLSLPVEPMARLNHFFRTDRPLEPLPLVKDISALGFRPEGNGYIGGFADWDVPAGFNWEVDHGYFERRVWPALASRVPAFETLRCERSWACHYARNTLDYNAIIGPWAGGLENLQIATGFSGHGVMHAPAAGRAIAELVLHGRYCTLDISRLSYGRVLDGTPYAEKGII